MSHIDDVRLHQLLNSLNSLTESIRVPSDFLGRMAKINDLLDDDHTGLVVPIYDFMIHAGTIPLKIETKNQTLDDALQKWQTEILNKNLSLDISRGLRELSVQYFRERWKSSLIVLNVKWEKVNLGNVIFEMPTKMWFNRGSAVVIRNNNTSVNTRQYFLRTKTGDDQDVKPIIETKDSSIFIRRPYNSWYDNDVTPYFVRRGVLFNALLKNALTKKQAEVVEAIIPYLLKIKAGTDALAQKGQLPSKEELEELKEKLVRAVLEKKEGVIKDIIATLSYDTSLEHFMPELIKVFDPRIFDEVDKNLLGGLGLIELEGFSKNRTETIFNPKVLVEEVQDAVNDWAELLRNVMLEMLERNKKTHRNLVNNTVRVIPSLVKAFLTKDDKDHLISVYNRGRYDSRSLIENVTNSDPDTVIERITKEKEEGLDEILFPPVIQNQDNMNRDVHDEDTLPDRQPGTPEVEDFRNARRHKKKKKEYIQSPFDKNSELPDAVKDNVSTELQTIFRRVVNDALADGKSEESAFRIAWSVIHDIGRKNDDGIWVKAKDLTIDYIPQEIKENMTVAEQIKYVKGLIK